MTPLWLEPLVNGGPFSAISKFDDSQSMVILLPRAHLEIYGDIFDCHDLVRGRGLLLNILA